MEIEQFGHEKKHIFCADDAAFLSGVPQTVIWKPSCRDNAPDPGHSFLGTVLNADPVGNAQYVIDQVNPLNSNPLNGLAAIGSTFSGIRTTVQQVNSMSIRASHIVRSVMRNDINIKDKLDSVTDKINIFHHLAQKVKQLVKLSNL